MDPWLLNNPKKWTPLGGAFERVCVRRRCCSWFRTKVHGTTKLGAKLPTKQKPINMSTTYRLFLLLNVGEKAIAPPPLDIMPTTTERTTWLENLMLDGMASTNVWNKKGN